MDFSEYQKRAMATAVYPQRGTNFMYPVLGLVGEAGEVAENFKRVLRDDGNVITDERRAKLKAELGDVMWYIAALCDELGLDMNEVAAGNIEKLAGRQKRNVLHGSGDQR